jgi:hypothetical protein
MLEATISEASISLLPFGKLSTRSILTVRGVHADKINQLVLIKSDLGKPMNRDDWEALSWELPDDCAYLDQSPQCACWRTLVCDIFDQETHFDNFPTETWTWTWPSILVVLEYLEMKLYRWIVRLPESEPHDWRTLIWQAMRVLATSERRNAWRRITHVGEDYITFSDFFEDDQVSSKMKRPKRELFNMPFEEILEKMTSNRLFCVTERGYFGIVPKRTQVGDQIVVLFGGHTPFVLREREDMSDISLEKQCWQLIGESYVHGMMDDEALNGLKEGHLSPEEFILV